MSKTYPHYVWGAKKATGTCMVCKTVFDKVEFVKDKRGKSWPKKHLTQLWEQCSWFRGEDEVVGVVCQECKQGEDPNSIGKRLIKWENTRNG